MPREDQLLLKGRWEGMSGSERANEEKRAVLKGQAAWENYTKVVCDEAAAEVGRTGGNGGDLSSS